MGRGNDGTRGRGESDAGRPPAIGSCVRPSGLLLLLLLLLLMDVCSCACAPARVLMRVWSCACGRSCACAHGGMVMGVKHGMTGSHGDTAAHDAMAIRRGVKPDSGAVCGERGLLSRVAPTSGTRIGAAACSAGSFTFVCVPRDRRPTCRHFGQQPHVRT